MQAFSDHPWQPEPGVDNQCTVCGEGEAEHAPARIMPPRGGIDGTSCSRFNSPDGRPASSLHSLCSCGQPYHRHLRPVAHIPSPVPAPLPSASTGTSSGISAQSTSQLPAYHNPFASNVPPPAARTTAQGRALAIIQHRDTSGSGARGGATASASNSGRRPIRRAGNPRPWPGAAVTGTRGPTIAVFTVVLFFHPQSLIAVSGQHIGWSNPSEMRLVYSKWTALLRRLTDRGLCLQVEVSSLDPPDAIFGRMNQAVENLARAPTPITIPPHPDATDNRPRWICVSPGNKPKGGSETRLCSMNQDSERPSAWTVATMRRWSSKYWAFGDGKRIGDSFVLPDNAIPLVIAPTTGSLSIGSCTCIAMHVLYDMGPNTRTTLEYEDLDRHIVNCPQATGLSLPSSSSAALSTMGSLSRDAPPIATPSSTPAPQHILYSLSQAQATAPMSTLPSSMPATPPSLAAPIITAPSNLALGPPASIDSTSNSPLPASQTQFPLVSSSNTRSTTIPSSGIPTPAPSPTQRRIVSTPAASSSPATMRLRRRRHSESDNNAADEGTALRRQRTHRFYHVSGEEFTDSLRDHIPPLAAHDEFRISAVANCSEMQAGVAFKEYVHRRIGGGPISLTSSSLVTFESDDVSLSTLLDKENWSVQLGAATGPSPIESIIVSAWESVASDNSLWIPATNDFKTLRTNWAVAGDRLSRCKTAGAVLVLYIAYFQQTPSDISPVLLHALVDGAASALGDSLWLQEVVPEFFEVLGSRWEAGGRIVPPPRMGDPCPEEANLVAILSEAGIDPAFVGICSEEEADSLRNDVLRTHLLGATFTDTDPHILAFISGMNAFTLQSNVAVLDIFGGASKSLIKDLSPTVLLNPEQLLSRLDIVPCNWMLDQRLTPDEEAISDAFRHWVQSSLGYVDEDAATAILGEDCVQKARNTPAFRARSFVKTVGGSPVLRASYKINLKRAPAQTQDNVPTDAVLDYVPPPNTHACFQRTDIFVTPELVAMARERCRAPPGVACAIDYYWQEAFVPMHPGLSGFNRI
ncbi:hypothetical protein CYLTODRAFT_495401 [Cylindrobasidium torrendii FP15055 ss-10]|uniref:Uncharacterized protein n=1 Tax=Cylindrobasidium torrendii FP15055 ss-10 TaxID=1314674 RepID=A0A0D7ATE5_9AGAR|nr:hypothetical protein CYLTODRAFT_495401 [Cylindrobasidium torrendii FP15055 ss-10]